jgi:hypothetical protein
MHGIYCKAGTCKQGCGLIECCVLLSLLRVMLASRDSFCYRVCAIRSTAFVLFHFMVSPLCDFISWRRLRVILFHGVTFV